MVTPQTLRLLHQSLPLKRKSRGYCLLRHLVGLSGRVLDQVYGQEIDREAIVGRSQTTEDDKDTV